MNMEYVYAAMMLHSVDKEISDDAVTKVLEAAGVDVDAARVKALVASLSGVDIAEAMTQAVLAPAAAAAAAPAPPMPLPLRKRKRRRRKRTRVASRVSAPCSAEQDREGASLGFARIERRTHWRNRYQSPFHRPKPSARYASSSNQLVGHASGPHRAVPWNAWRSSSP